MLSESQKAALRAAAEAEGLDEAELLRAAEAEIGERAPAQGNKQPSKGGSARPVADRLLVGFLPFIRVRELRKHWLGLEEPLPDDDMTCGAFAAKHGGDSAPSGE